MDDDGHFDEQVAARYDESARDMFEPAVVGPVVDLLGRDISQTRWAFDSRRHVSVWQRPRRR